MLKLADFKGFRIGHDKIWLQTLASMFDMRWLEMGLWALSPNL